MRSPPNINKPFCSESTINAEYFPTVFQMNCEMESTSTSLCNLCKKKEFPSMYPETTLSKIEATPNYLQTFTSKSIFQYGMNYEVNFQIKKKWIL